MIWHYFHKFILYLKYEGVVFDYFHSSQKYFTMIPSRTWFALLCIIELYMYALKETDKDNLFFIYFHQRMVGSELFTVDLDHMLRQMDVQVLSNSLGELIL